MSEKLKIVYRPLQELSPYAHNARTHSTEQVAQLVESIKQFGWTNPVLIDEKGEIIAGHGRVMAAEMLKMDSVPVIVLSGLTDEQKKAYRLADNRLPMNAGWDEDLLRMELSDLINADFDVSLTGFIPTEIDELLTDVLPGTGNEEEPYTTKIDTPVYEPSGGKPDISELYDDTKTQELISRIRSASLDPDIEKYRLAGYEGQGATANSNASRMLRNARVYRAISYFRNQYQKRYTADLDLLVSQLMAIVQADPNQLAQFRRVNCRYCWGENPCD